MIAIKVSKERIDQREQEVLISINLMQICREVGIPVIGSLALRGVERGKITYWSDDSTHIIEWREDAKDTAPATHSIPYNGKSKSTVEIDVSARHLKRSTPVTTIDEDDDEL